MDAEGRYIPIVEDDMGEGFKDELPPEEQMKILQAGEDSLASKIATWEERLEKRPEPEPAPEVPPDPEQKGTMIIQWTDRLMKNQTVYLMTGTDPNEGHCPILYAQPYRVAGSRENGKLILKPAKLEPDQVKNNPR